MAILAVNAGSSTLKFALHPVQGSQVLPCVLSGNIQGLEPGGRAEMGWREGTGATQTQRLPDSDEPFTQALQALRERLAAGPLRRDIAAVAHRVVHGGARYRTSVVVTPGVMADLTALEPLAPLHQPHNLAGLRAFQQALPAATQVACFDTAFHATLPDVETAFALPQALAEQGVRRYGFHGLSYQFIAAVLQQHSARAQGRVLMAHLGNGASLCATRQGQSCATTMGFSALDGLMMGTRSGALDPGVLLYLLERGWDHDRLQALLYRQSGLQGVSGISADMRRLRADGSAAAQKAIALFTRRVVRESGAMVACLGGLDVIAFSGGIGEHDAQLRADVCASLAFLGVHIDPSRNQGADGSETLAVHAPGSAVEVWVVPTDEGLVAAREAVRLLRMP